MKMCVLVLCACAGAAFGQALPVPSTLIQATPADAAELDSLGIQGTPVYSSIPGPYAAFASGTFATRDDYQTTIPGGFATRFTMDQFKFVGGVSAVGGILDFFILEHNTNNVMASFGVQLGQAGDFIWTITLNGGAGIGNIPAAGDVQIQTRGTTTGRWFMTTTAPLPGSNDNTFGHGSVLTPNKGYGAFEMQKLPAPGSLALLGLGGLVATRRRR
jgi:hypothetical protein